MEKPLIRVKTFWNSWLGLITQMVISMLLGLLFALMVNRFFGY